jgi:arginyl-tRNA--protein-N-Asp/Glu arginylyltransferase
MEYLHWDEQTIPAGASAAEIAAMYERGYVFTRKGRGIMQQTRSCRIDLSKFELSSENRRILKKTADITLSGSELPYPAYDFTIGKLAKDFYTTKFGDGTLSANKMKEMMTDPTKSNFNCLFAYSLVGQPKPVGYCVCYTSDAIHHYSFPFYDLTHAPKDMGMGMMIRAIEASQKLGHRYIYLGSLQRPSDTYKFQFAGFEWFDGGPNGTNAWRTDTDPLKQTLKG